MTDNRKTVNVEVTGQQRSVTIRAPVQMSGASVTIDALPVHVLEPYDGVYEVTPSDTEQTLTTKDLRMKNDVIIKPIPQNYGLITWNGSFLTVS